MYINKRLQNILEILTKTDYINTEEISKILGISKRTTYYDIVKLQDYLESKNINLNNIRSLGYYLGPIDKEEAKKLLRVSKEDYILSPKERYIKIIIDLLILKEKLTIEKLCDKLEVSRNTILGDIKYVRNYINKYNLELTSSSGYKIEGKVNNRRYLFINLYNEYNYLFDEYEFLNEYNSIKATIEKQENNILKHSSINYILMYLASFYKYYYNKNNDSNFLYKEDKEFFENNDSNKEAKILLEIIKKELKVDIHENEVYYIQTFLTKDKQIRELFLNEKLAQKYIGSIKMMVKEFEKISCISIDDYEKLSMNIFEHLMPTLFKVRYGIYYPNFIKDEVKEKYKPIYQFTKQVIKHIEQELGMFLNDDELAYIAMYFGGYTTKMGVEIKIPKIIIVCNSGMATSQLLKNQIEQLFDLIEINDVLSLSAFKQYDKAYDFAISTVDISEGNTKVIKVNPILTDLDKQNLISQISNTQSKFNLEQQLLKKIMSSVEKHTTINNKEKLKEEIKSILISAREKVENYKLTLSDILKEENISLNQSASDWKEAIQISAKSLKDLGRINDDYTKAMTKSIENLGPYIILAPNVAMPHARPEDGVNKLGISITTFKEEVKFSQNERHKARLFITLAPKDKQSHLNALASLNQILSKKENIENIINATDKKVVLDIIKKHS